MMFWEFLLHDVKVWAKNNLDTSVYTRDFVFHTSAPWQIQFSKNESEIWMVLMMQVSSLPCSSTSHLRPVPGGELSYSPMSSLGYLCTVPSFVSESQVFSCMCSKMYLPCISPFTPRQVILQCESANSKQGLRSSNPLFRRNGRGFKNWRPLLKNPHDHNFIGVSEFLRVASES